jgi:hypothetical protein
VVLNTGTGSQVKSSQSNSMNSAQEFPILGQVGGVFFRGGGASSRASPFGLPLVSRIRAALASVSKHPVPVPGGNQIIQYSRHRIHSCSFATPTIHIEEEISPLEMGQTDALSTRTYCTRWSMTVLPSFQSGATTLWMPLRSLATTLLWFTGSQVCGDQVRLSETPTLLHPHESSPAAMLSSIDPSLPARTPFTCVSGGCKHWGHGHRCELPRRGWILHFDEKSVHRRRFDWSEVASRLCGPRARARESMLTRNTACCAVKKSRISNRFLTTLLIKGRYLGACVVWWNLARAEVKSR